MQWATQRHLLSDDLVRVKKKEATEALLAAASRDQPEQELCAYSSHGDWSAART